MVGKDTFRCSARSGALRDSGARRAFIRRAPVQALALAFALVTGSLFSARAEQYLTVDEAQKLCFPTADRFEADLWRFSRADKEAIAEKAGVKLFNRGNRVRLAYRDDRLLGVLFIDQVFGKHELIDYAVALSPSGETLQVELLEYRESHGRDIRNESWRAQFRGKTAQSPVELNEDIYNISGATVSCRSVTDGVRRILATYEIVGRPRLVASGALSAAGRESVE